MGREVDRRWLALGAFALVAAAIVAVVLIGRAGGGSSATASSCKKPPGPVATKAKKTRPTVTVPHCTPPSSLVANDLERGTGTEARPGHKVSVQYVGVGFNTGKEFDASWNRGKPFEFQLGAHQVIPGWEAGIEGMKVGGRRELIIPPELAYGANGSPPSIGPNETLVFVIDLLKVK